MRTLDIEAIRLELAARLPLIVQWPHDPPITYDLTLSRCPLRTIEADDFHAEIEPEWTKLWLFGERYLEGGARPWLTIHEGTGEILGLDVESGRRPVFFMSSDVDKFVRTFEVFDELMRQRTRSLDNACESAAEIDPGGFPGSDWRWFAEHLRKLR